LKALKLAYIERENLIQARNVEKADSDGQIFYLFESLDNSNDEIKRLKKYHSNLDFP
jgi:hypothetical protein